MEARQSSVPFRHWVIDGLTPALLLRQCVAEIPSAAWPKWVVYANESECKRTTRDLDRLGPATVEVFRQLQTRRVVDIFGDWLAANLEPDPMLHGGGIHVVDPGGWLRPHLDYQLHPFARPPMQRFLSLVLFLNDDWREEWGGALEFYDDMGREAVTRIYPQFGRAVAWLNTDAAYHGTQQTARRAAPRLTAAVYYLTPAGPGVNRKRALYVPRR